MIFQNSAKSIQIKISLFEKNHCFSKEFAKWSTDCLNKFQIKVNVIELEFTKLVREHCKTIYTACYFSQAILLMWRTFSRKCWSTFGKAFPSSVATAVPRRGYGVSAVDLPTLFSNYFSHIDCQCWYIGKRHESKFSVIFFPLVPRNGTRGV